MSDKPLSPAEVRKKLQDPGLRIEFASTQEVETFGSYVRRVLKIIQREAGISGMWVSDESCVSDCIGPEDRPHVYEVLNRELGLDLDMTNDDDHFIVKIAQKLFIKESA